MNYQSIISIENLYKAWEEFICGKRQRKDVAIFSLNLSENIFDLHQDLLNKTYSHSDYQAFNISDPKPRNIHKASVRDRLLHHAIYRVLYPYFDKKFIHDSYSCRLNKGTHKALNRFRSFGYKISKNNTKTSWTLKCDMRKFFASIDHQILLNILTKYIEDKDTLNLLERVIESFNSSTEGKGLPLGNLTSQLLVNIYMNEFDHFVKHKLKIKYYIRYADDFVLLSPDKSGLTNTLGSMKVFLSEKLKLELHPSKVSIKTLVSGVDFLGWIHFPTHRILRTATKRRVLKNLKTNQSKETRASYLGLLKHGDTYKIREQFLDLKEVLK
ncbi:MAG: Retron-type RNA-directed DNA polymerase [Parcubacteria bacterium C7867-005]|nr:MAG: Retron-type RNA-directed DNA polymerase [Parcubacteria bacterium C7867-005]